MSPGPETLLVNPVVFDDSHELIDLLALMTFGN